MRMPSALPLPRTLRGRLIVTLSLPLLLILGLSVIADYRTALALANDAYDHALTSTAIAIASRLERSDEDRSIEADLPPAADEVLHSDPYDKTFYLVLDQDGHAVVGDPRLAVFGRPWAVAPEIRDARLGEQPLRLAIHPYASPQLKALVLVAETTHKRDHTARLILQAVIWPNLLLIAAVLLIVSFGTRFALLPLLTLGRQISARQPQDLGPIPENPAPAEARPLVHAINALMGSLNEAMRAQQAFLSDASHQLRTPLTALQTQLELTAQEAPPALAPRIRRLQQASARLIHFTRQMLSLARSAPDAAAASRIEALDLADMMEDCASDFLDLALARHIDLGFEPASAPVEGTPWLIREMLANLVTNAIAYTPEGGHVTVRCGRDAAGGAWLEVEDDGPGIPPAERDKVFERFYRGTGNTAEGTGLGLAIVRQAAEQHAAAILIDSGHGGGGCRIRVSFPVPHAAVA